MNTPRSSYEYSILNASDFGPIRRNDEGELLEYIEDGVYVDNDGELYQETIDYPQDIDERAFNENFLKTSHMNDGRVYGTNTKACETIKLSEEDEIFLSDFNKEYPEIIRDKTQLEVNKAMKGLTDAHKSVTENICYTNENTELNRATYSILGTNTGKNGLVWTLITRGKKAAFKRLARAKKDIRADVHDYFYYIIDTWVEDVTLKNLLSTTPSVNIDGFLNNLKYYRKLQWNGFFKKRRFTFKRFAGTMIKTHQAIEPKSTINLRDHRPFTFNFQSCLPLPKANRKVFHIKVMVPTATLKQGWIMAWATIDNQVTQAMFEVKSLTRRDWEHIYRPAINKARKLGYEIQVKQFTPKDVNYKSTREAWSKNLSLALQKTPNIKPIFA